MAPDPQHRDDRRQHLQRCHLCRLCSTLQAWDAIVELTGANGVRRVPIQKFYIKAGQVDIKPDEIQTAILIPKESYENCFGNYFKYAMRNAMDIATTGCSVNVRLSADKKTMERVRIGFGVAGPVPMRAVKAEAGAAGKPLLWLQWKKSRLPSWRISTRVIAGVRLRRCGSISPSN